MTAGALSGGGPPKLRPGSLADTTAGAHRLARPSDGLNRTQLVIAVADNHIGANELAARMTDVSLRRLLDAGITGRTLWERITDNGKHDVVKTLDECHLEIAVQPDAKVLDA